MRIALALGKGLEDRRLVPVARTNLGPMLLDTGRTEEAELILRESVSRFAIADERRVKA